MTKEQAHKNFMAIWDELTVKFPEYKHDNIMQESQWESYIAGLYENNIISETQYYSWSCYNYII